MKLHALIGSLGLTCAMATVANAQWHDDFDAYATGPLCAQSVWDEWTGSSGVDADVDNTQSFSTPNSVKILATNDVVFDFSNASSGRPSSGHWLFSIRTYVPSGTTGSGWVIIMNDYPSNLQWSLQVTLDATNATVTDGVSKKRKLKFDQWVSVVVAVDLDNNRFDAWYGDTTMAINKPWYAAGGQAVIAALDLYGDSGSSGSTGVFFDDPKLEQGAGGPLALTSSPNPAASGATLKLFSESPLLGSGDPGALFSWTINGSFVIFPILFNTFDVNGEWTLSTTVPAGLTGIEAGLKMFAVPAGGKVMMSNEDVIIFL